MLGFLLLVDAVVLAAPSPLPDLCSVRTERADAAARARAATTLQPVPGAGAVHVERFADKSREERSALDEVPSERHEAGSLLPGVREEEGVATSLVMPVSSGGSSSARIASTNVSVARIISTVAPCGLKQGVEQ